MQKHQDADNAAVTPGLPGDPSGERPSGETAGGEGRRRGPLSGLRVLDLSRVLAGPFCSLILGDLGAEVIKVEDVEQGDLTRTIPPLQNGMSHYFLSVNRNKRSVAIDARTPAGRDLLCEMVKHSDVVLENFRPGVMDRLGLGYEVLREFNPQIIVCSISGFGATGSMSGRPSFDLITQGLSGVMSVNGHPANPPTKLGLPLGDIAGGLWAAIAILAALNDRKATARGAHIDLSLLEGLMSLLGYIAQMYTMTGIDPERVGNGHHNIVPYGVVQTLDGHLILALHVGTFWHQFCKVIGRGDLASDPRFNSMEGRKAHRVELEAIIADLMRTRPTSQWLSLFEENGIPSGPVLTIAQALDQNVLKERNFIRDVEHPSAGPIRSVASPIRFSDRYPDMPFTAPQLLGADTRAVLQELCSLDADAVEALISAGIAGSTSARHETMAGASDVNIFARAGEAQ